MTGTVLIAGASGSFGSHVKSAFEAAGWTVRVWDRKTQSLMEASVGVDLIVNALNPPNYQNWDVEIPRITREVIAAAKANNATVLVPGNVYNYGTQIAPWSAKTPQIAASRKGQVRIDMEAAYKASGVRTIILRAGDFIGGGASAGWLDLVMLKSLARGKFVYPGAPDIPHAWTYLPDLARATVALANKRGSLEPFCDLAFPGYAVTGTQMLEVLQTITGRQLKLSQMSWWPLRVASPFWSMGRELLEMRYLWEHPHSLDGTEFARLLPEFKATDISVALAAVLPVNVHPNEPVVGAERIA